MFNNIVLNKSQKYQQGRKIDDYDYDGDDEDPNISKQQQNQKEDATQQKEKATKRNKNKQNMISIKIIDQMKFMRVHSGAIFSHTKYKQ